MTYISTKLKREFIINKIVTIHYFEYMKDFSFSGESHNFWELAYVDKGSISVVSDSTVNQLYTGDIIFHHPNEFHALHSVGEKSPNLVNISFICNSPAMNFFEHKQFHLSTDERLIVSKIISEANHAFSSSLNIPQIEHVDLRKDALFGSQHLILIYLEMLLIHLFRRHSKPSNILSNEKKAYPFQQEKSQSLLDDIVAYMEQHLCEQLTIDCICSDFAISPSTLYNLFQKKYGESALNYFQNIKISAAKNLIREGNMNFTEIAHYLSYNSLQYFSKRFKKAIGMSPFEYATSVKNYSNAGNLTSSLAKQKNNKRSY